MYCVIKLSLFPSDMRGRRLYEDLGDSMPSSSSSSSSSSSISSSPPGGESSSSLVAASRARHGVGELLNTMVLVTSDNTQAAEQIGGIVQHPYTLITPQVKHLRHFILGLALCKVLITYPILSYLSYPIL